MERTIEIGKGQALVVEGPASIRVVDLPSENSRSMPQGSTDHDQPVRRDHGVLVVEVEDHHHHDVSSG